MRKSNQIYLLNLRKVAAIFFLFLILLSGCRSTKYVPEGEYLLNSVEIESDNKEIKPNSVKPYVKQKANSQILGLVKFKLWLYNRAPKNGDGWTARTLRKIGEAPNVYDANRTVQSEREIKHYLSNKGFTNAEVSSTVEIFERRRKTEVKYYLVCNTPYRIASAKVSIQDTTIAQLIQADSAQSLITKGNRFDLDVLDAERERISSNLKNTGYYDFNKEAFSYQVDTTIGDYLVDDILMLEVDTLNPQRSYEQYHLNEIRFIVGYDAQKALKNAAQYLSKMDTVIFKEMYFMSEGEAKVKPEIIYRNNLLKPGTLYSKKLSDRTHSLLSAIGIIRYVNINYSEVEGYKLNCNIYISLAEPQSFSLELEGTNISGHFGAAATVGYAHKNLFSGAEKLNTNFTIGREAIIGLNDAGVYKSNELGVDITLAYPKFIFPFLDEDFKQKSKAKTTFGTSFDFQERPEYVRNIATADMVYSWQKSKHIKHHLTPIMLNYISIPEMSAKFEAHIDTTEYLKYSYQDHVIFGSRYGITFQGGQTEGSKASRYLHLMIESSGNMLNTFNKLTGQSKTDMVDESTRTVEDSYYEFLNVRYSQYIKFDLNGVMSLNLNKSNTIVYRTQFGIGIPYANSSQLPFEKRYFGGGANGIRAWMVRSLGPGSYLNEDVDYYNQSGDINFLLSAEYRFKLFWVLEGALFADAGNTWTIRDYEGQPGAAFQFNTFYKQIAAGVGTGARIDLNFFVFRFDVAWKALDPTQDLGQRWVLGKEWSPVTHIAIGYPF